MEIEKFFSGYCRQQDNARLVEAVVCDGHLEEVDCCYGSCIYQSNCPIAREIQALTEE